MNSGHGTRQQAWELSCWVFLWMQVWGPVSLLVEGWGAWCTSRTPLLKPSFNWLVAGWGVRGGKGNLLKRLSLQAQLGLDVLIRNYP